MMKNRLVTYVGTDSEFVEELRREFKWNTEFELAIVHPSQIVLAIHSRCTQVVLLDLDSVEEPIDFLHAIAASGTRVPLIALGRVVSFPQISAARASCDELFWKPVFKWQLLINSISSFFDGRQKSSEALRSTGHLFGTESHMPPIPGRKTGRTRHVDSKQLTCHVLLVEDCPDDQRMLTKVLTNAGAKVTVKCNGEAAVKCVESAGELDRPYDLVLMDLEMPIIDGLEATKAMRTMDFQKPIVGITASSRPNLHELWFEAGCTKFMQKPVQRKELVHTIAELIPSNAAS